MTDATGCESPLFPDLGLPAPRRHTGIHSNEHRQEQQA